MGYSMNMETEHTMATTTTPNEAWELYVGCQTPAEFMTYSESDDTAEAVAGYVRERQYDFFDGMDAEEMAGIAGLLVRHIEVTR